MVHLKLVYEDKIKLLEKEIDSKQQILYENKTQMTTLDLKLQQLDKDKVKVY